MKRKNKVWIIIGAVALAVVTLGLLVTVFNIPNVGDEPDDTTEEKENTTVVIETYDISVTLADGDITYELSSETINTGEIEQITLSVPVGRMISDDITVTNANHSWNADTGILSISNPSGDVSVNLASTEAVYKIDYVFPNGGVIGSSENPTEITHSDLTSGMFPCLYFSFEEGYALADTGYEVLSDFMYSEANGEGPMDGIECDYYTDLDLMSADKIPAGVYTITVTIYSKKIS